MDRVRLGRALGYGTRHAAKTVAALAEAASAPGPAPRAAARTGETAVPPAAPAPAPTPSAAVTYSPAPTSSPAANLERPVQSSRARPRTTKDFGQGVQHFKRSFWGPLATFSGALWLRVTGLFFALIAFAMGEGAWRLHRTLGAAGGTVSGGTVQGHRFWLFLAFALLFGYFTVSSFVRASLRERRASAGTR